MVHPLSQLSTEEIERSVGLLRRYHNNHILHFKVVERLEPPKAQLVPYLEAERYGRPLPSLPPRTAHCTYYDLTAKAGLETYINLESNQVVKSGKVPRGAHLPIDHYEAMRGIKCMWKHSEFDAALTKCGLVTEDQRKVVDCDGWMYGCDQEGEVSRFLMFIMYCRSPKTNHAESNLYAFPLPFVPVYDVLEDRLVRIDWCATGGDQDDSQSLDYNTLALGSGQTVIDSCVENEYWAELSDEPLRQDLKPLYVQQPEGASFTVGPNNLIEWQKWRFRIGTTPREGLVLHDVSYDGRSVFYRCSVSEMTVPYGDPRPPLHRKMAFDFGDCGGGRTANELHLGCDCLGTIKYFDHHVVLPDGTAQTRKSIVCLHEQDDGLLWKHSNYRTDKGKVVRRRILVIQTILTVGNYEYIFAWHLDQAAGIWLEIRASGIVSTQYIDAGKTSQWGTVVSPSVLATSHQHVFSIRFDPAVDGQNNSVVVMDTELAENVEHLNPYGTGFRNKKTFIETSSAFDAKTEVNRYIKVVNENVINPVSGNAVGYKLHAAPTALLMAPEGTIARKRAAFATHHFWVTKYKDDELYAGGVWTNQSSTEIGGVQDAIDRKENVRNEDIVVWHSFGLTHHPRVEDFPVMPAEMLKIGWTPNDFFTKNPSIDVPESSQRFNRSVDYRPHHL